MKTWAAGYRKHGKVVGAPDPEAARSALISGWWRQHRESPDKSNVMIALRRVDVADLNERARACMRAAGHLGADELEFPRAAFSSGDRVVATRNDRRLGLTNGTLATVTAVDLETSSLTLRTDRGEDVEIRSGYLADGHLAHAYALTAHKAQGMTVDLAFVLGSDELYREWGYTALSRHREEARFYVPAPPDQPALPGLEPATGPVGAELDRTLQRSKAKDMATDVHAREGALDRADLLRRVEEAAPFQTSVRSLQTPTQDRQDAEPPAASELQAAEARLAATLSRRDQLELLQPDVAEIPVEIAEPELDLDL